MTDLIDPTGIPETPRKRQRAAKPGATSVHVPPRAETTGQTHIAHHDVDAGPDEAAVHPPSDTPARADRRFVDPLVCEIVEVWRQRQDMVRAQQKLTLQIKAICRRFCAGDKGEAAKLYASIGNGREHPKAEACAAAVAPLRMASAPVEEARAALERRLDKLGKSLPIAHLCDEIKGVNGKTLAAVVGECGDLSAYKSVSAVWKRAGLAVIAGERQRRKSNPDEALLHGYSPSRHAVFWNVGEALFKAQGKDENAGPYRLIYDARREYEGTRPDAPDKPAIIHNRAKRYMLKALIKRLVLEWRAVARTTEERLSS